MSEKRRDKKGRILRSGESQRSDGRYMYRYMDVSGKRQTVYSWKLVESDVTPRGKRVEQSLREKEEEIKKRNNVLYDGSRMTLNELFEQYINLKYKIKGIKAKTIYNYTVIWNKNMKDRPYANMQIGSLRRNHIISLYQDMLDEGVGAGSIILLNKNVCAILNYAVNEEYITRNVAKGCLKELEVYTEKREALTLEEQAIFLQYVASNRKYRNYYWMFVFLIETALRGSEAAGLTWNDIDLRNGFIDVNHQLLYACYEKDNSKRKLYIAKPKTRSSVRKVPLSAEAIHAIKKQKEYMFRISMIKNYEVDGCKDFVFLTSQNKLWHVSYLDHYLHEIVESYNQMEQKKAEEEDREPVLLPNITVHILRHTGCTRMAEAGIDMKTLQKIMGHDSLQITMEIYNHVDDMRMRREIEKLDVIQQRKFV